MSSKTIIYTKDYCPYCKAAKTLLRECELEFEEIEVSTDPRLFADMVARSQRRTVPQIFIGETHVGGYTDLERFLFRNSVRLRESPSSNRSQTLTGTPAGTLCLYNGTAR